MYVRGGNTYTILTGFKQFKQETEVDSNAAHMEHRAQRVARVAVGRALKLMCLREKKYSLCVRAHERLS